MADVILAVSGIYQIRNTINGKIYVGQAVNIKRRKTHHFYLLRNGIHNCTYMQHAFKKHGEEAFEFAVIELCEESVLTVREQFWMDAKRHIGLYNLSPSAGSNKGVKHSAEARAKIGAAAKGRKSRLGHTNTAEANAKVAAARRGKKMTAETKAKISAIHLGRKLSPEHLAKMSAGLKGIPRTEEWKRKISESQKGKKLSAEHIEKVRISKQGKKRDRELAASLAAIAANALATMANDG